MEDYLSKVHQLLMSDETLSKRFHEICMDPRIDEHTRVRHLGELLNTCMELVDLQDLAKLGQKSGLDRS
jgi:hypothetical protein